MTAVEFPDIVVSFKNALNEVLASFFDGGVHSLNDIPITFAQPLIVYDKRDLVTPTQLTIAILGNYASTEEVVKCSNPQGPSTSPGVEIRAKVIRFVSVSSPYVGGDATQSRKMVDTVWGQLYAITNASWELFATKGIIKPTLSPVPEDIIERPTIVEASGSFTAEIRFQFGRYNLQS